LESVEGERALIREPLFLPRKLRDFPAVAPARNVPMEPNGKARSVSTAQPRELCLPASRGAHPNESANTKRIKTARLSATDASTLHGKAKPDF